MVNKIMNEISTKRFACIFPGQGSQAVGMLASFADDKTVQVAFEEASDALGMDMWALLNDETKLHETMYTQPALLTASVALYRLLQKKLPYEPNYLAGHSLGEYSALCAAGVLSLDDAVRLVHERGKLMSDAVLAMDTQMAAVLGLTDEQVGDLCRHATETVGIVDPANFNSPGQVVIAGTALGVAKVLEDVQNLGKKSVPLKVSVPSHCALMQPAAQQLADELLMIDFCEPDIPVIQNLTASIHTDITDIKSALIGQLSQPVQWAKTMDLLADKKVQFIIECGHGNVLTNLCKRQNTPLPAFGSDKPEKIDKILEQFYES